MNMLQEIKNWWNVRKANIQNARRQSELRKINEEYNVVEKDGYLYIVCGINDYSSSSRVVAKIDGNVTANEIITMIQKARNAQLAYLNIENQTRVR